MTPNRFVLAAGAALALAAGTACAQDVKSEMETIRRAINLCSACHGEGGRSKVAAYPSLAGQMSMYTIAQLKDFRSQTRAESDTKAYMWGVSALLEDATIVGLAQYYAEQDPPPGKPGNPKLVAAGRKIYEEGIPARNVRACATCHGDTAEGAAGFPRLAGQHADYVFRQLKIFGTSLRPHGVIMKEETKNMTTAEMRAVAEYVQSR